MAGTNAAIQAGAVSRETAKPFILDRAQAYIGVLIDDLISRGAPEPYRMFTSRAEYRLTLRADNADQRLTPNGLKIGLVGSKREKVWNLKSMELEAARTLCGGLTATPNKLEEQGIGVTMDGKHRNVFEILRYPNVTWDRLTQIWPQMAEIRPAIAEQIQIDALYAGYIERQEADINAFRKDEGLVLPDTLNYDSIGSLSTEIKNRLKQVRPTTLGAAARIPGVTPAAIIALLRHVKKKTVELVETDAA